MSDDFFSVEVPELGTFAFWRHTARRQIRAVMEARTILGPGAADAPEFLAAAAFDLATIETRAKELPRGFTLDDLDIFEAADLAKLKAIMGALRAAEDSFRQARPR